MSNLDKQMEKWARRRSRGKWSFVFRFGVLGMGMSWGFLMAIFGAVFIEGWSALPLLFAVSIPVGALFGLVMGLAVWSLGESSYQTYLANCDQDGRVDGSN